MTLGIDGLKKLLQNDEHEHLEFKEAKQDWNLKKLAKYCVAMANEGGGYLVLGVTDRKPRKVVGTSAFQDPEEAKHSLYDMLRMRIELEQVMVPDKGRVLVFRIPPRPTGIPQQYDGSYWMRAGESVVPMTPDRLRTIFEEVGSDFSAEVCPNATLADLSPEAVGKFRSSWQRKSHNDRLANLPAEQLLRDAGLLVDNGLTYSALILLGTDISLARNLAQAEVIFEYRSSESAISSQRRMEFRQGFLLFEDTLWDTINLHNDAQEFRERMFVGSIPTFNEVVVREGILNAICHRDYRGPGSVFIRQYPRRLDIVSPGGFPPGITNENILEKQVPRNRLLAEALAKCGRVERAGQGVDLMFRKSVLEGKSLPDYSKTDDYEVYLSLNGTIRDTDFITILNKIGSETLDGFVTEDIILLDLAYNGKPIPERLRERAHILMDQGILERISRGRGTKYILSQKLYDHLNEPGIYTRRRGLDQETKKELLLKHIRDNRGKGSPLKHLCDVLPERSSRHVKWLLDSLRKEGKIRVSGRGRAALWYPT